MDIYADDTAILYATIDPDEISNLLQIRLYSINNSAPKGRIKINPDKSARVPCTLKRTDLHLFTFRIIKFHNFLISNISASLLILMGHLYIKLKGKTADYIHFFQYWYHCIFIHIQVGHPCYILCTYLFNK
jgi:lipid II:glycine glycyltransferase (peptidoglycan interpeptide bridge formation enzyme)